MALGEDLSLTKGVTTLVAGGGIFGESVLARFPASVFLSLTGSRVEGRHSSVDSCKGSSPSISASACFATTRLLVERGDDQ